MSAARYFATCARGLEPVLARELAALEPRDVEPGRGGVAFAGDHALLYRANLWLRTAVRVLRPVLEAPVASPDELYRAVQSVDWQQFLTPDHTLAVDCNVRDSHITHSHYAALRTKDAVCDQFLARVGRRPSVDTENPLVKINLHIHRDRMTLSLDSSGASLHKRGYRPLGLTKAPLNEALAAGIILLTEWDGSVALADPMCGSGTLAIEASWLALRRPPGLTRKRFGFMGWLDFDIGLWTALRDEARRGVLPKLPAPVVGSDVRRDAVSFAEKNARAAGVGHLVHFTVQDVGRFRPPDGPPGVIVCNPPYGERIGEERALRPLYEALGTALRERCPGWRAFVFSGNPLLEAVLGLPPVRSVPLYNGKIPCRLLEYRPP
jgi:putative N6-adenine-specific DNA methylase